MEFMVTYAVSEQGIHLRTMENFLAALNSAFQPFDIKETPCSSCMLSNNYQDQWTNIFLSLDYLPPM